MIATEQRERALCAKGKHRWVHSLALWGYVCSRRFCGWPGDPAFIGHEEARRRPWVRKAAEGRPHG